MTRRMVSGRFIRGYLSSQGSAPADLAPELHAGKLHDQGNAATGEDRGNALIIRMNDRTLVPRLNDRHGQAGKPDVEIEAEQMAEDYGDQNTGQKRGCLSRDQERGNCSCRRAE